MRRACCGVAAGRGIKTPRNKNANSRFSFRGTISGKSRGDLYEGDTLLLLRILCHKTGEMKKVKPMHRVKQTLDYISSKVVIGGQPQHFWKKWGIFLYEGISCFCCDFCVGKSGKMEKVRIHGHKISKCAPVPVLGYR